MRGRQAVKGTVNSHIPKRERRRAAVLLPVWVDGFGLENSGSNVLCIGPLPLVERPKQGGLAFNVGISHAPGYVFSLPP